NVPWLDGTHPLGSACDDDVAGVQRVERRGVFDQFRDSEDQILRIRALALFAVDRDLQIQLARVRDLIARDEPGTEHSVAVRRLAQAPLFGPPNRNVETDGIAGDVFHRIIPSDVAGLPADHDGKLHFVIVPAVELPQRDALAWTDEGARGLQEESSGVDRRRVLVRAVVQLLVVADLLEMLLIVDRSA